MYDILVMVIHMKNIIFHIDVNNAFLSWTAIDLLNQGYKYDIRNSYAVVGGDETKRRGIVLAKSNSAKKLGVVTGETLYSARKKCKVLKVYSPNYSFYQKMSSSLFQLLSKYTDEIEPFSIDECFFDYTHIKHLYGNEIDFAYKLKDEIKNTLGFTVNIGIANNKLCAKMASDFLKPNRVHTLYDEEIITKMYPLPIEDLFGIGKKTAPKLRKLNINTIADLANYDELELSKYFKNTAKKMIEQARGIDNSIVQKVKEERESIGNTTTLERDYTEKVEIYSILEKIADNVTRQLRKQNKYAYVVSVQLKDCYFKNKQHQMKLKNATNLTNEVFNVSKKLLDEMWEDKPIRLVGIRLDNLTKENNIQISLFDKNEEHRDVKLEKTLDELKDKFGNGIIKNASLKNININKKY